MPLWLYNRFIEQVVLKDVFIEISDYAPMNLPYIVYVGIVLGVEVFTMAKTMTECIVVFLLRAPEHFFEIWAKNLFQPFVI